ncbi:hypothetical protein MAR_037316 [Mya arenaria]|uniref:Uncharacterized protein n=1 Tax=Mya arenaria TaxID=6604 RepID=A0ABY7FND7_MYAAR|nr:hypothetical protein MAR_037316 [Mya arenaria]
MRHHLHFVSFSLRHLAHFCISALHDSLGYRGFKVHKRTPLVMASQAGQTTKTASQIGSHMMTIGKGTNAELEKLLLKKFSGLDETLITHITTAQQPVSEQK